MNRSTIDQIIAIMSPQTLVSFIMDMDETVEYGEVINRAKAALEAIVGSHEAEALLKELKESQS